MTGGDGRRLRGKKDDTSTEHSMLHNENRECAQPVRKNHRLQMSISITWLSGVCKHQLSNKVRYLRHLMQQLSQILSGRLGSEHLPLLTILMCFVKF
jgi:hypothetical protein